MKKALLPLTLFVTALGACGESKETSTQVAPTAACNPEKLNSLLGSALTLRGQGVELQSELQMLQISADQSSITSACQSAVSYKNSAEAFVAEGGSVDCSTQDPSGQEKFQASLSEVRTQISAIDDFISTCQTHGYIAQ